MQVSDTIQHPPFAPKRACPTGMPTSLSQRITLLDRTTRGTPGGYQQSIYCPPLAVYREDPNFAACRALDDRRSAVSLAYNPGHNPG